MPPKMGPIEWPLYILALGEVLKNQPTSDYGIFGYPPCH